MSSGKSASGLLSAVVATGPGLIHVGGKDSVPPRVRIFVGGSLGCAWVGLLSVAVRGTFPPAAISFGVVDFGGESRGFHV